MCLTRLLDPKEGFIIDDAPAAKENTTQSREKKEIPGSSAETTTQSGGSKSALNKNRGENQYRKAAFEERNFSLFRWFQEQKENIGKYFKDDHDYQRLEQ
ncbi:hypothetical protein MKW94_021815 [Papaver nudicaule]|uniref:Uncharacterized protein n=1 Tax=Papaver nudicaule TaxID=74823 RepID=A0AA41SDW0_PAPNU|nr:hypothetical protein [Papaver nudicaule]